MVVPGLAGFSFAAGAGLISVFGNGGTAMGGVVTLIGCYQGYHATGGGRGVGIGTTRAVVLGSASTLVVDYFLSDILLSVLGTGKGG